MGAFVPVETERRRSFEAPAWHCCGECQKAVPTRSADMVACSIYLEMRHRDDSVQCTDFERVAF